MSEWNEAIEAAVKVVDHNGLHALADYIRSLKRPEPQGVTASSNAKNAAEEIDAEQCISAATHDGWRLPVNDIAAIIARHFPEPQPAGDVVELVGRLLEVSGSTILPGSVTNPVRQAAEMIQRLAARSGEVAGWQEPLIDFNAMNRAIKFYATQGHRSPAHAAIYYMFQYARGELPATPSAEVER